MSTNQVPVDLARYLSQRLAQGASRIGQVRISPDLSLGHIDDDSARTDLIVSRDPHAAIEIAKFDDAGKYRPLKTAPTLRHGWRLTLGNLHDLLLALDFLYPAAIGTLAAMEAGTLKAVPLRITLARQSGMYAVVKKLTNQQAEHLIHEVCGGCLRRRLWPVEGKAPEPAANHSSNDELTVYCAEACNLLVAAGRRLIKKSGPAGE